MDKDEEKELREYDFALRLSEVCKMNVPDALYICQCLRDMFKEKLLERKTIYICGIGRFRVRKKVFKSCRDFQLKEELGEREASFLQFTSAHSLRAQLNQKGENGTA